MKNKLDYLFLFIGFIIKFGISLFITNWVISVIYSFVFAFVYYKMISNKTSVGRYVPFIMLDFIICFYLCYKSYGLDIFMVLTSLIYFAFSSFGVYFFIFEILVREEPKSKVAFLANIEIDKGIKALEENDYNLALETFSKVIKENKDNYLGYMGMCRTLSKMDKRNLKKINYYHKKCLKYAPRELRESINKKYD